MENVRLGFATNQDTAERWVEDHEPVHGGPNPANQQGYRRSSLYRDRTARRPRVAPSYSKVSGVPTLVPGRTASRAGRWFFVVGEWDLIRCRRHDQAEAVDGAAVEV